MEKARTLQVSPAQAPGEVNSGGYDLPLTSSSQSIQPKIVAAIPAYNEERFIGSVVLKAKKYVNQVIVIDDGSSDKTAEIAAAAGAMVIGHDVNEGKGMAMNTAFAKARELGADVLVLLDGDGQHEPMEIQSLVQPILTEQADIVVGSRFLTRQKTIPRYRTFGQRILTIATNWGSGVKLTDSQSGFRAFSPKALSQLHFSQRNLGAVDSEIQFLIKGNNLKVVEAPILAKYDDKAKRNPLLQGLDTLGRVLGLISRRRPLLFISLPGVLLLVGAVGVGFVAVRNFASSNTFPFGYILLSMLLCILGAIAISTGIILQSITSLISQTGKPGK